MIATGIYGHTKRSLFVIATGIYGQIHLIGIQLTGLQEVKF